MNKEVDNYIAQYPDAVVERLKLLRSLVFTSVPDAEESIAYGMPAYKWNKKPLVYFAGFKNHIGVYATPITHEEFADVLKSYKQGKGSVQFQHTEELPLDLIRKMIEFKKVSLI